MGAGVLENKYYDWEKTITYNADVTIVIGARDIGKTYGLRKKLFNRWKKTGEQICEVVRYVDEIADVGDGYFSKMEQVGDFDGYIEKYQKSCVYVAEKPEEGEKPVWKPCVYLVALTQMQRKKKKTFPNVRWIVFDEALLDRLDRFHNYLPNEFVLLANVVNTCTREDPHDQTRKVPHVFLLGNACDFVNPYFMRYGISKLPPFGKSWHDRKTCLLDYVDPKEGGELRANETVAGRMLRGTDGAGVALENKFDNAQDERITKKPTSAQHLWGFRYRGRVYGVWVDWDEGYYHVTKNSPEDGSPLLSLTRRDGTANVMQAKRSNKLLQSLVDAHYDGLVKFDSAPTMEGCLDALSLFGVR